MGRFSGHICNEGSAAKRLGEDESLNIITACPAEYLQAFEGLNSLSHGSQAKAPRQFDDGSDDGFVLGVGCDVADKRPVDF